MCYLLLALLSAIASLSLCSIGREYDKAGNPQRWWSKDDLNDYEEQTECIVDQYSCFRWKPAQMNVNYLDLLRFSCLT